MFRKPYSIFIKTVFNFSSAWEISSFSTSCKVFYSDINTFDFRCKSYIVIFAIVCCNFSFVPLVTVNTDYPNSTARIFFFRFLASAKTPLPVPPAAWKITSTPLEYMEEAICCPLSALAKSFAYCTSICALGLTAFTPAVKPASKRSITVPFTPPTNPTLFVFVVKPATTPTR